MKLSAGVRKRLTEKLTSLVAEAEVAFGFTPEQAAIIALCLVHGYAVGLLGKERVVRIVEAITENQLERDERDRYLRLLTDRLRESSARSPR